MGSVLRLLDRHRGAGRRQRFPRQIVVASGAVLGGIATIVALAAASGSSRLPTDPGTLPDRIEAVNRPGLAVPPPSAPAAASDRRAALDRIILPDLLIVKPSGLTKAQMAGLREISGVQNMIAFDGARIRLAGRQASVIGVRPSQFRSWVPLGTATDQRLWAKLAAGGFIESSQTAGLPRLAPGRAYRLTGAGSVSVPFAASARIGIAGVDLLVNQAVSARLGLVHLVAALISAPGPSAARLTARVRAVLGPGAKIVDLRYRQLRAANVRPGHIGSYLQLFRASAATYCPAMSWTILAAIGQIESADGQNVGPSSAGALGPMQFLPSTWARWGIDGFGGPGPPDIMNPLDAVPSAARMLCADGASAGTPTGLRQAIFAYNHAGWYVNEVLALAARYAAEWR